MLGRGLEVGAGVVRGFGRGTVRLRQASEKKENLFHFILQISTFHCTSSYKVRN